MAVGDRNSPTADTTSILEIEAMPSHSMQRGVRYRHIKGFPGYAIGSDGSVWSKRNPHGGGGIGTAWHLMATVTDQGYRKANLWKDGHNHTPKVHRLVLEAFVGPCPSGMVCRHLNGVRHDNRLENLVWGTHQENAGDKVKHGNSSRGEKSWSAKLTADDVRKIRRLRRAGAHTDRQIAAMFGVSKGTVNNIVNRWTWKHV